MCAKPDAKGPQNRSYGLKQSRAANPGKEWNKYLVECVCALHATKVSGAAQDREFRTRYLILNDARGFFWKGRIFRSGNEQRPGSDSGESIREIELLQCAATSCVPPHRCG